MGMLMVYGAIQHDTQFADSIGVASSSRKSTQIIKDVETILYKAAEHDYSITKDSRDLS